MMPSPALHLSKGILDDLAALVPSRFETRLGFQVADFSKEHIIFRWVVFAALLERIRGCDGEYRAIVTV